MPAELILPRQRVFVSKQWGWEDWILNDATADYCLKHMFVKAGRGGSIHMHPVKDEVMICDSGCLTVQVYDAAPLLHPMSDLAQMINLSTIQVHPGKAIRLKPGEWHRLSAECDTYFYEASTFHSDDDVRRVDTWQELAQEQE